MKRVILTLMMLVLPSAVIAQQNDSSTAIDDRDSAGPDQARIAAASDVGNSSTAALGDTSMTLESAPAPEETPEQATKQARAPGPSPDFGHPTNGGSMVGYIDDALQRHIIVRKQCSAHICNRIAYFLTFVKA